jgi:hypothetical protein
VLTPASLTLSPLETSPQILLMSNSQQYLRKKKQKKWHRRPLQGLLAKAFRRSNCQCHLH